MYHKAIKLDIWLVALSILQISSIFRFITIKGLAEFGHEIIWFNNLRKRFGLSHGPNVFLGKPRPRFKSLESILYQGG